MVRLRHPRVWCYAWGDGWYFNPTMVRLRLLTLSIVVDSPALFQSHYGAIATSSRAVLAL